MSTGDAPPFHMIVERGPKLVPATADDAERLDTWRSGSKVNVAFVRNGSRPMERKWFAILGLVVKQCDVPWTTKEAASQAVKLAIGIVDYCKTVNGNFMQWPKSLTELSDPELDDAVRDMMDLIHRMTGVDPETLKKEAKIEDEDSSDAPSTDEGSGATPETPSSTAATESAEAADQEAGAQNLGEDQSEAPASIDPDWLRTFAKAMLASIGPDETVVVNQSKGLFIDGLSADVSAKARSIVNYARACCRDELDLSKCREMVAGIAGCDVGELAL